MKKIKNYDATVFSQRHRNMVYEQVIKALEKASEENGVTRTDIANKLGYSKSHISRLLSGPSNWTLDTVSYLLFAVEAEMTCKAVFFSECQVENHFHSLGEDVLPGDSPWSRSHSTQLRKHRNNIATISVWSNKELSSCH